MKILILSKSSSFVEAIRLVLGKKDIEFDIASDKDELSKLLSQQKYDFVICDLECVSNIDCVKDIINNHNSDTDIVVMSFSDIDYKNRD